MRRELVNRLRFVLEDLLPPIVRDSFAFRWAARIAWGRHVLALAEFRRRAPYVSFAEYKAIYQAHPRVHEETDNSRACIARVLEDILGQSVCDVGCGTGHLIREVRTHATSQTEMLAAVDFILEAGNDWRGIATCAAQVTALPFGDKCFDTVICTHVLEHILNIHTAVMELRRICARRLILVVPREREYRYTFNPHFHFFPYKESFVRSMIPLPARHECIEIGRDIYYVEDRP